MVFSGHNDRAVVALCRFFRAHGLPFSIVASGSGDAIHRTAYADNVVVNRLDRSVELAFWQHLAESSDEPLAYCPTTEFINLFMLSHRPELEAAGWRMALAPMDLYLRLSDKASSAQLALELIGVAPPPELPWGGACAPCVLKPRNNVRDGLVRYPAICASTQALASEQATRSATEWFVQAWVDGQSYYLCGYLAADGKRAWYWQQNLLQQPGGKSIVLARQCASPGLDADALFDRLHAEGFRGPFMMELIADDAGKLHFIEINPRLWGPLQLALAANPQVLHLFAQDLGATFDVADTHNSAEAWYAWAHGAGNQPLRAYPAAPLPTERAALLSTHDVYALPDTAALHGNF